LPPELIQGTYEYVWIQGQWKNFRLRVPEGGRMNAVYRGCLPSRREPGVLGLDPFLLREAVREGARVRFERVLGLDRDPGGRPVLLIQGPDGASSTEAADFVAVAGGINH